MQIDPQHLEDAILSNIVKPDDKIIIEFGCGEGRASFILAKRSKHYIAIDNDQTKIDKAISNTPIELKEKIEFKVGSATNTGLSGNSVDVVFMLLCFHEIGFDDQSPTLVEAARVLRKGGQLIIIDPEENPTDSVQALYNTIYLNFVNFDHSKIVAHSKLTINNFIKDKIMELSEKSAYSLFWEFESFDELANNLISDNKEADWNESNKQLARKLLEKFPLIVPDRMEVTILTK